VSAQNFTPKANPDSANTTAGSLGMTGNVLTNDNQGNAPATVSLTSSGTQNVGNINLQTNGNYSYTPPTFVSNVETDTFTYTITDQDGETSTSTLTISISPQNLIPQANPDSVTINANQSSDGVTGNVLSNDILGDAPTVATPIINFISKKGGALNIQANGNYNYLPPSDVSNITTRLTELFQYTMTDNDNDSSSSTLTINIDPSCHAVNDNDQVVANPIGSNARGSTSGNITTNDIACALPVSVNPISVKSTSRGGSFNLLQNGDYTYSAPSIVTSTFEETFTYRLTDKKGITSSATLTMTVNPPVIITPPTRPITVPTPDPLG
jgi:VCBS repeat-containing protein